MKMSYHTWTILLLCFLGAACTRVETYDLTEDERAFVDFEPGDEFKLKSHKTDDTIVLVVQGSDDLYHEIQRSRWRKDKLQRVYLHYFNPSYSYCRGITFIRKDGDEDGPPYHTYFSFLLSFSCLGQRGIKIFAKGHDRYEYPVSLTIGTTHYRELYYFENDSNKLYYSKEKGYIKVENTVTGDVFTIVE